MTQYPATQGDQAKRNTGIVLTATRSCSRRRTLERSTVIGPNPMSGTVHRYPTASMPYAMSFPNSRASPGNRSGSPLRAIWSSPPASFTVGPRTP